MSIIYPLFTNFNCVKKQSHCRLVPRIIMEGMNPRFYWATRNQIDIQTFFGIVLGLFILVVGLYHKFKGVNAIIYLLSEKNYRFWTNLDVIDEFVTRFFTDGK
jgi:hypothetical protein